MNYKVFFMLFVQNSTVVSSMGFFLSNAKEIPHLTSLGFMFVISNTTTFGLKITHHG